MASADPFYIAKEEIEENVQKVQQILTSASSASASTKSANSDFIVAKQEIEQLEVDVEDLGATIQIVEQNPGKFGNLSDLQERKQFVTQAREQIRSMKRTVDNHFEKLNKNNFPSSSNKYGASGNNGAYSQYNDEFVSNSRQQQKQLLKQQDDQLVELSRTTERLNQTALVINSELQDHTQMLQELDDDIERETEKMNFVMGRVGKLLRTSNTKQICTILAMFAVFMFLLMMVQKKKNPSSTGQSEVLKESGLKFIKRKTLMSIFSIFDFFRIY